MGGWGLPLLQRFGTVWWRGLCLSTAETARPSAAPRLPQGGPAARWRLRGPARARLAQDGGGAPPPSRANPCTRQSRARAASRGRSRDVARGVGACAGAGGRRWRRRGPAQVPRARREGPGGARAPRLPRSGVGPGGGSPRCGRGAVAGGGGRRKRRRRRREGLASRPPGPAPPSPPFAFLPCGAFRPAARPGHAAGSGGC